MTFYKCNPDKAIRCSKTTCYLNGGNCRLTTNIDYAKDSTPLWLEEINKKEIKTNGKAKKEKS